MNKIMSMNDVCFRKAVMSDMEDLLVIENSGFAYDRLSKRSFRHWIKAENGRLLVAVVGSRLVGYGLIWCHKGTRLARLYSLVVINEMQGLGIAKQLLQLLELDAVSRGYLYMRLEVSKSNEGAIALYKKTGYRIFGEYFDYYDDHSNALRMQKTIRQLGDNKIVRITPWYQQTTNFTCGPAAMMMAMASLDNSIFPNQSLELKLWREATTIFMTSGHGGCHPLGLALAAAKRGFKAEVFMNSRLPLFMDGVRSQKKKEVLEIVHNEFLKEVRHCDNVRVFYKEMTHLQLVKMLNKGYAILVLISTYRLDNKKAPHWVTITSIDDYCLYVHDPDADFLEQQAIDCQYMPIARQDFEKMCSFGVERLKVVIAIKK